MIAQTRQLNMREVLQYSPGRFSWALATDEGSLRETKKAALANEIAIATDCTPRPTDCTIVAMAIIQKHQAGQPDNICRACEYPISKVQD